MTRARYMSNRQILVVEDERPIREMVAFGLRRAGFDVVEAEDTREARARIADRRPDLVLVDWMLPDMSGLELTRALKKDKDMREVPIIMLTARAEEQDKVSGLEGGADDYVSKPFSSRELLARVRAQARRARGKVGPDSPRIEVGDLVVDSVTMTATLKGRRLELTSYEFALLRALAERPGRVLGREQLLELMHGSAEDAFDRSIDVHVSRLRHKLEEDPRSPRLLKTIRGVGYVLTPDDR